MRDWVKMPTSSKKGSSKQSKKQPVFKTILGWFNELWSELALRFKNLAARRPHRSFRLTKRRDYLRPLKLPGLFAFTNEVTRAVWRNRKLFIPLILIYVIIYATLVGLFSQSSYDQIADTLKETSGEAFSGNWGRVGEAGLLMLTTLITGVNEGTSQLQQMFAILLSLLCWLTVVWLLRNRMAGHKVNLRDGIYSSGAPLFATVLIAFFIVIQLLPVALAGIGYVAALETGLLSGGAPTMMFWIAAALLVVLSLYWITSSLFAMVIITLPGTYPFKAIKAAGDLMVGRRIKILIRWLWMFAVAGLAALLTLLVITLLDMGIKALVPAVSWLPLVPVAIAAVSGSAIVWGSAYIYLLYRKVVDYVPE